MNHKKGFTLIELLGTIAIIAVILTIGIGGAMKMSAAASRKETKARLVILLEALDAYALDGPTGEYPKEIEWEGDSCGRTGLAWGNCPYCKEGNFKECGLYRDRYMARLLAKLEIVEECRKLLSHLPDNCINRTIVNVGNEGNVKKLTLVMILDSYDQPIIIIPHGGLGGQPTLMSLGADVKFGTDDDIYADR